MPGTEQVQPTLPAYITFYAARHHYLFISLLRYIGRPFLES